MKKADATEHPEVLDHVGILTNEPLDHARFQVVFLIVVEALLTTVPRTCSWISAKMVALLSQRSWSAHVSVMPWNTERVQPTKTGDAT